MKIDLKANRSRRSYRECACIFGLCSKSSSSATTENISQQVAASEGSLSVGAAGKYQETGAVDLSGATGKIGSTELAVGGDLSIQSSDLEVLKTALDKYAELSSGFGTSLNSFVSQQSEDQDKKVASLITSIEKAKESEDSAAQNRKIFIWIAVAVLGLIGVLGFRKT
jgi:hypothetical protein